MRKARPCVLSGIQNDLVLKPYWVSVRGKLRCFIRVTSSNGEDGYSVPLHELYKIQEWLRNVEKVDLENKMHMEVNNNAAI